MNIRKKILFNPSHLKSTKPDTSDTTTAHTKNSTILEQSKTFRFSNQKTISTRRQRNYLRTLSKDPKQSDLTYNNAVSIKKRNIIIPSLSTMSNENFMPIKKSALGRKFLMEQDQLPPLVSLKRTELLTSQQQRKLFNYPSSVHVSSNKQTLMRQQTKKHSLPQQQQSKPSKQPQTKMMVLGQNYQQIERRKLKLNSLNVASFYTTQKSIALSKYSMVQREAIINEGKGSEGEKKERDFQKGDNDQKVSRFASLGEEGKVQVDEVKQSPEKGIEQPQDEMDESIVEEIEKNQSVVKEKLQQYKKCQQNSSNEWSQTLKSSYADSNNKNEVKMTKNEVQNKINEKGSDSNDESSLCESEVINSQQVQVRKNTQRNANKSIQVESETNPRQTSDKLQKQRAKQSKQQVDEEESSLCESYQVETPEKRYE